MIITEDAKKKKKYSKPFCLFVCLLLPLSLLFLFFYFLYSLFSLIHISWCNHHHHHPMVLLFIDLYGLYSHVMDISDKSLMELCVCVWGNFHLNFHCCKLYDSTLHFFLFLVKYRFKFNVWFRLLACSCSFSLLAWLKFIIIIIRIFRYSG